MAYYGPGPEAEEVQRVRVGVRARRLEHVDAPDGQVADEQEGDHLPTGLVAQLGTDAEVRQTQAGSGRRVAERAMVPTPINSFSS